MQYSTGEFTEHQLAAHTWMGLRSAEDEVLAALPDSEIKAAMQALPTQLRTVLYHADVEGFRNKQIAEIMGTPNGTVMSRLHRGLRHLRRLLVEQVVR
jgi:RNA polymerase sigma-70 factor (ECF subfamily)